MTPAASPTNESLSQRATAAARAIDAGGVIVAPTETVRALACDASNEAALTKLWNLRGTDPAPLAWHVADADRFTALLPALHAVHARLIERLLPGPVLLAIELDAPALAAVRTALGVRQGVIDDGTSLFVRVPSHTAARTLLRATKKPVVMASIPAGVEAESGVDAVLDEPPAPSGKHSTLLRLLPEGRWEVARAGMIEERFIRKQLTRTILFLCTGNTCRSPMAEAIARAVLGAEPPAIETIARSAGVTASHGMPAAPEAVAAVRAYAGDLSSHRSAPATRQLIAEADVVFAMTRAHAQAVRDIDPTAEVLLLDPEGHDVPDPIGSPQPVYDETAQLIERLVRARLRELDA